MLAKRLKSHKVRKNKKHFHFYLKKLIFFIENRQNLLPKMRYSIESYSHSEIANVRLPSHAFISILRVLTKTNFFEGIEAGWCEALI
jgi:hypothetical protein